MAAAGKKAIEGILVIDVKAEMGKKQLDWIRQYPELTKKMKPASFSRKVQLDPRKWDKKKLSEALYALARYELKLMAMQAVEWQKKDDKKGSDTKKEMLDKFPKYYLKTVKKIKDKCSTALEELESDKGDNKKGLRDGKIALSKLQKIDFRKIFTDPRADTAKVYLKLSAALKKADKDEKAKEAAFKEAETSATNARKGFDGDGKDVQSAIAFLLKTATDISRNKEANALLKAFGSKVKSYKKNLVLFGHELDEFEKELLGAAKDFKEKKLDAPKARSNGNRMAASAAIDKASSKVQAALLDLKREFTKVEKQLK